MKELGSLYGEGGNEDWELQSGGKGVEVMKDRGEEGKGLMELGREVVK